MRRFFYLLCALAFAGPAEAHVGSPNVIYEGLAGPYPLRIIVRPPGVVPGLAEISVRVLKGPVTNISVLPVRYDTGSKGSPAPDRATPVRGEPGLYNAQLWLMTSGAYSIFVNAEGENGNGTTVVPINSIATTRLEMSRWFGAGLLGFAIFLVLALISLVGAAVRESALPPGEVSDRPWRARVAMISAGCVLALVLFGGRKWWSSVDSDYRNNRLYKPEQINASVRMDGGNAVLQLERVDGPRGRPRLIPDHGKLMHVFLVKTPGQEAFAHLHPAHATRHIYQSALPPLPAGKYRVYADVTQESGFTQTLMANVELPAATSRERENAPTDPDDAFWTGEKGAGPDASSNSAGDSEGAKIEWLAPGPFTALRETALQFRVTESNGGPAVLEPYLGMQGHAVIESKDETVYTHLHPFGNISMASQQRFVETERTRAGKPNFEVICGLPNKGDAIVFPYEFPRAGEYRIWVQVKTKGKIRTAVFDAEVGRGKGEG